MVVAFATLVATILNPQDPSVLSRFVTPLLIGYNAYALSVVLLFQFRREAAARLGPVVHGIDLFWAVAVTSATGGASSHFSPPLYVFPLLAAAFRWGLRETLISGAIAITLLVAQAGASLVGLLGTPLRVGDFVMRSSWVRTGGDRARLSCGTGQAAARRERSARADQQARERRRGPPRERARGDRGPGARVRR